ncbi:ribonuclease Z [Nonomuraea sp. MG754425]|uniref:MBL fold metallo-hydrolase n=1 Tax=Nonomuraea sp. MG754425 TaxID=2570319 RepID=UPI001F181522|nr:MBL fold metallo-hydrolase [Nonomuraea sp. MG754425]MCF6467711.1 ribonuclease Z [Nonomuraea sp. MG754425]
MQLHFVGTGSIFHDRLSASALVDGKILIDTPNGSVKAMRRAGIDPAAVDICLITHFHADHFFDIIFLLMEQGLVRRREREMVLIGPIGFAERVAHLFGISYPGTWEVVQPNLRPRFVEFGHKGGEWSGDGYRIQALPVEHTTPIAFGYLIADSAGTRLGYTGDTVLCPSVELLAATSHALTLDTSFLTSRAGHMGLDDVERIADAHPGLTLFPTHLGAEVTGSDRRNVVFPEDGQTFELGPGGSVAPVAAVLSTPATG